MNIESLWESIKSMTEIEMKNTETREVHYIADFSIAHTTFGDIKDLIEKWNVSSIVDAIDEMQWLPIMESSDGDEEYLDDKNRNNFLGFSYREICEVRELNAVMWINAKRIKNKKKFF